MSMSSSPCLQRLPTTILHEIFDYLSLNERHQVAGLCQELRIFEALYNIRVKKIEGEVLPDINSRSHSMFWNVYSISHIMFWNSFVSLQTLDLGPNASSTSLSVISSDLVYLSSLKRISMARSQKIHDPDLWRLSQSSSLASTLEEIDITFCRNTTYRGTFCLREKFTNLKLLRRQPAWMDGKFETPFSVLEGQVEVHTYWPDGSFQFTRGLQSNGFVCDLQEQAAADDNGEAADGRHVSNKLQYNNFVPPENWPSWSRYSYRPGVTLLQLEDEVNESGGLVRSVLVAQNLRGTRPPTHNRRQMEEANSLMPLGGSRYYSSSGDMIPREMLTEESVTMISRMRVIPFDPQKESLLPPESLFLKNQEICLEFNNMVELDQDACEALLHEMLGGDPQLL